MILLGRVRAPFVNLSVYVERNRYIIIYYGRRPLDTVLRTAVSDRAKERNDNNTQVSPGPALSADLSRV